MKRPRVLLSRRLLPASLLVAAVALLVLSIEGCHKKVTGIDGNEPGAWRLELRAPAIMYRDPQMGHVVNDTITVRLFDAAGSIAGDALIYAQAFFSPGRIASPVTARADTLARPWGANPALIYYGAGPTDPALPEVITAQAVVNGDTVARGEVRFLVHDHAQLVLMSADTFYRDASGTVPHEVIKVRLFNDTGGLINGAPVHCQCNVSRDSVTAFATTYADTLTRPAGSQPPITYWGAGDVAEPEHRETVNCYAVVNGDTTTASRSFYVWSR